MKGVIMDKEKRKEYIREYMKMYRKANKERLLQQERERYAKDKTKHIQRQERYYRKLSERLRNEE